MREFKILVNDFEILYIIRTRIVTLAYFRFIYKKIRRSYQLNEHLPNRFGIALL